MHGRRRKMPLQRQRRAGDNSPLLYYVILSALSTAVTAPAVIEFGLFSLHPLQTLTPDFIEGDGI